MRARRDLERMDEPVPDAWAAAVEVCWAELADRALRRQADPLGWLSRDARVVLVFLAEQGGTMAGGPAAGPEARAAVQEQGLDPRAGLFELVRAGLVELTYAADDGLWPPVPVAILRYEGELPGVE